MQSLILATLLVAGFDSDKLFHATCMVESSNNPTARNGDCYGIAQIRPDLAKEMGYKPSQCYDPVVSEDIYKRRVKNSKTYYHAICVWRYGPNSQTARETARLSEEDFKNHKHSKTLERFRQSSYWRTLEAQYER